MIKRCGLIFLTLLSTSCGSDNNQLPAPPVVVSKPLLTEVTPYLTETGNTVAYHSVDLVARVSGYLDSYHFTDGSMVKKDRLLFVIQPEPYAEQVEEAKATLDANVAHYNYDVAEYERQVVMYKKNATSEAEVQKWLAQRDASLANVDGAKANLINAKITYGYTHILAPFDGRIGRHLVDPGNLVGNGVATKLATIEQISPMYVYFNLNELDLLRLRKAARAAGFKPSQINRIPIEIGLQDEPDYPHKGHLDFVNTGLEASTGTIQIRGILENKDFALLPGLFVRVRIALSAPKQRLTVPATAIMADQIGSYVFTVDKHHQVHQVHIQLSDIESGKDRTRRTVLSGLKPDDLIVVDGIQNATPGGVVNPTVLANTTEKSSS